MLQPSLWQNISIHALREEGDSAACRQTTMSIISIHALREEGDDNMLSTKLESSVFLSTPSARRATHTLAGLNLARGISTHALREEGDVGESGHCHFRQVISTHALREEGDVELRQPVYKVVEFLPTPSARRATPAPFALVAIFFRFLPTPSARRATEPAAYCLGSKKFLPTPSARRATG